MLAFHYRFHGHGGLRYVHMHGAVFRNRIMTIKVVKNRRKHPRLAVVVSKKTHKSAVGRNRIRRRVYEVLRHEVEQLGDHYDIVCIVQTADVRSMPYVELEEAIKSLLNKASLYKTS